MRSQKGMNSIGTCGTKEEGGSHLQCEAHVPQPQSSYCHWRPRSCFLRDSTQVAPLLCCIPINKDVRICPNQWNSDQKAIAFKNRKDARDEKHRYPHPTQSSKDAKCRKNNHSICNDHQQLIRDSRAPNKRKTSGTPTYYVLGVKP